MAVEIVRRRFTVEDYHRMGKAGILRGDDRVELIAGEIVAMTPIGPRHSSCIDRANRALVRLLDDRAIVRIQSSVRLDRYNEPEPDIVLLRPREDFFASRIPGPADILLLVEVAESSLEYDRVIKARLYAAAGVPEYWVVDLGARLVASFHDASDGVYRTTRVHHPGDVVAPALLSGFPIAIEDLTGPSS